APADERELPVPGRAIHRLFIKRGKKKELFARRAARPRRRHRAGDPRAPYPGRRLHRPRVRKTEGQGPAAFRRPARQVLLARRLEQADRDGGKRHRLRADQGDLRVRPGEEGFPADDALLGRAPEARPVYAGARALLEAPEVHSRAFRRGVGGTHGVRAPRRDGGLPRPVGVPGLCLRRADRGRVGAARLQRAMPPAGRRVLRRFFPDRGRQGRNCIGGDISQTREKIQDGIAEAKTETSIVKPYVMSHGTMEVYSLKASRKFYEEFLGLECVRHAKPAMVVRCGLKFHIVAVEVGAAVHPQNVLKYKEKYNIRQVLPVVMQHGVYSFYMEDLDHNWWEIQHYPGFQNEDL